MNRFATLLTASLLAACAAPAPPPPPAAQSRPAPAAEWIRLHQASRAEAIQTRRFTHAQLWSALDPLVDRSPRLAADEIGRSAEGRPIRAVRFGQGPTRVLLWSQMHGDESTATLALLDIVRFLSEHPDHPLARRLHERLTLVAVPMLNPDGAERFQRRNAHGVDVNRDARALATPEARALKAARDRWDPHFAFNLHDQNVRTRVGRSDRLAAIALLAPPPDASGLETPGLARAKRVAAVIRAAVEPLVEGHLTRYDDTHNPRAFGDLMQQWGASTVLIEAGGWRDDPEKQYLRRVNFVGILAALDAIATERYALADPAAYESLPRNGPPVSDLLIRGGHLVMAGLPVLRADVAANFADPLARTDGRITDVGDLEGMDARDTLDVSGLFLHPVPEPRDSRTAGHPGTGPGAPASWVVRQGADPASQAVWVVESGVVRPAPR